jgi:hypothetical protein
MKQIRVNIDEKNRQTSIYIGQADTVAAARQVVINNIDEVETLCGLGGVVYFGQQVIG